MHGNFSQLVIEGPTASRVLQQQGRVLLDADWNAACAVLLRAHRELASDLIGPHGGPAGDTGLEVATVDNGGHADLSLGPGVYYVDGIRIEVPTEKPEQWSTQPYPTWPDPPVVPDLPDAPYLVYLDVWERHVDAIQDDSLREVALGGPDTTSRAEVVWQVRAVEADVTVQTTCPKFPLADWRDSLRGTPPRLRAWATRDDNDDDPCLASPDSGYRGVENQLYRVEITDVTNEGARFLWSRENGSVTAAWVDTEGDELVVEGLRDRVWGFGPGDWVELTWDGLELSGLPGSRVRVVALDGGRVRYDESSATSLVPANPRELAHPIVRRWDARPRSGLTLHHGAIDIVEGEQESGRVRLEDGIEVQFVPPPDGADPTRYRVGDYWTIPARVATGGILWPSTGDAPDAVPPHGVRHHYAPLAWVAAGGALTDLRRSFAQLAKC